MFAPITNSPSHLLLVFQVAAEDKLEMERRGVIDAEDPILNSKSISVKSNRWTNEELLLAVQGVRQYGLDFKVILFRGRFSRTQTN